MRYDIEFLRREGFSIHPAETHIKIEGVEVPFHYTRDSRLFYVHNDELSEDVLHKAFAKSFMFDHLWIEGGGLTVFRSYGTHRRFSVAAEDREMRRMVENLESERGHFSLPDLFNQSDRYTEFDNEIRQVRNRIAESAGESLPRVQRLLAAQELINRFIMEQFIASSRSLENSDSLFETIMDHSDEIEIVDEDKEKLLSILSSYCWSLDPSKLADRTLTPRVLHWLFETYTCPLSNLHENETPSTGRKTLIRKNRRTGSYYTPEFIAHYIASRCLAKWLESETGFDIDDPQEVAELDHETRKRALNALKRVRLVDPSVGAGAFLIVAADWLEQARIVLGDQTPAFEIRRGIVASNLYGVDVMANAIETCKHALLLWQLAALSSKTTEEQPVVSYNIKTGNSLIGGVISGEDDIHYGFGAFHWAKEFPEIFETQDSKGFDILVGNPPYGNILTEQEKKIIKTHYKDQVHGGRSGTWNIASVFVVRARAILKTGGQMGLLLPNSVLRVGQFSRTRRFISNHLKLWEIVDEGSPFDGVTLEMVSIFGEATESPGNYEVRVVSRRADTLGTYSIQWSDLTSGGIFVLYHDDLFRLIKDKGVVGGITAGRGRDIPHEHVSLSHEGEYTTPYATKGRSIKRYRIDQDYLLHADDWFRNDSSLLDSYNSEFLVAVKNYPYPRCVMKPKGTLHGGGTVRIRILSEAIDPEMLGLILNSRMVRYICTKYLTNASELTTCLNTGIMSEVPVVVPTDSTPYSVLFRSLQTMHQDQEPADSRYLAYLESVSDALVYALYLLDDITLEKIVSQAIHLKGNNLSPERMFDALNQERIRTLVTKIMENTLVREVEQSPLMRR